MKYRNLLPIIVLSLFLFSIVCPYIAKQYPAMVSATVARQFRVQRNPEEGFTAGTLVHVPDGYKCIEDIHIHDTILDDHAQPKRVLMVVKRITDRCIRLVIDSQSICIGYEQTVRLPHNIEWIIAGNVQAEDYALSADGKILRIDQLESISEFTVLYQLSVEDHIFCVGPENLIVHNADIATVGTAMVCLEYVAYVHPVIALVVLLLHCRLLRDKHIKYIDKVFGPLTRMAMKRHHKKSF